MIATLQQQQHVGVMLHMVQTGQRNSDGGLCHCQLELVESVTRDNQVTLQHIHVNVWICQSLYIKGNCGHHSKHCACVDLSLRPSEGSGVANEGTDRVSFFFYFAELKQA